MRKKSSSENVIPSPTHVVSPLERARVRHFAMRHSIIVKLPPHGIHPLAIAAMRNPTFVSAKLRGLLHELGNHGPCDSLVLKDGISIPSHLRLSARKTILRELRRDDWTETSSSYWVYRAMKQLIACMGAAGYFPQLHSYEGKEPQFIFKAKGVEDLKDERGYPHKLPDRPATIMPHLPLGRSVFGDADAQHEGIFAPDVVAFIFVEGNPHLGERDKAGPRVYGLNSILARLDPAYIEGLQKNNFRIAPDPAVGRYPAKSGTYSNVFGTVDNISPLGGTGPNGPLYMRIDSRRHEVSPSAQNLSRATASLGALNHALDAIRNENAAPRLNLERGDVLLVNNRRAATAWEIKCQVKSLLGWARPDSELKPGDRLIYCMHFYSSNRIVSDSEDGKSIAA